MKVKKNGLCNWHAIAASKGEELKPLNNVRTKNRGLPEDERFFNQVNFLGENGCWNWVGHGSTHGRGNFTTGSRTTGQVRHLPYRWSYMYFNNVDNIDGMTVHHKCTNGMCVNPAHLQLVTSKDNTAEMVERTFYLRRIAQLEAEVAELKGLLNGNQARY